MIAPRFNEGIGSECLDATAKKYRCHAAAEHDSSRVVIGVTNGGDNLVLYVSPDRPDAWKRGGIARFAAEMRAKGFTILVSCGEEVQKL